MKFRVSPQRWWPLPHHLSRLDRLPHPLRFSPTQTLFRQFHAVRSSSSFNAGGNSNSGKGSYLLLPGATAATIIMLGALHARRLYGDKKVEDMKEKGIEQEFSPDAKAAFLRLLPLRSVSRFWGFLMNVEIPVIIRPSVYKAWARAFHSNLEEAAFPLEDYASLQEFFVRTLKEGSRPFDPDPNCLASPVDGKVLRIGELKGSGAMIEQVKGFSYSASSLLGTNSSLHEATIEGTPEKFVEQNVTGESNKKSWWHVSFASPKVQKPMKWPKKGMFYCVIYLNPGDYHRVHSPVDWHVMARRHFSGRLLPQNERAARTIKNLYIENERVVLEGRWKEGFLAIAAIGATNVGSIKLAIEPELRTNNPGRLLQSAPPDERLYEPQGIGLRVKKGDEIAAFNMGSTVVVIFQAPILELPETDGTSEFEFCVKRGDRVRVGEAIGIWNSP